MAPTDLSFCREPSLCRARQFNQGFWFGCKIAGGGPGDRAFFAGSTVRAANLSCVLTDAERRPAEEEFAGVVAWFVVDVDVRRVVGGFLFLAPPWIGEPMPFACDEDEFAAAGMSHAHGFPGGVVEDCFDPRDFLEDFSGAAGGLFVTREDMRDLMIDHGEGGRGKKISVGATFHVTWREEFGFAQVAIRENGALW